jgi:uncharacterized protein YjeT (DUF2065 family)
MKKANKKENLFKLSSFLFGLGLSSLVFACLVLFIEGIIPYYFSYANAQENLFANCVFRKMGINNSIITTCIEQVQGIYPSFHPGRGGVRYSNGTYEEHYSMTVHYPPEFYNITDSIFLMGIIFGISCLVIGAIILRLKNY